MHRVRLDNGQLDVYYTGYLKADSGFEYSYRTHRKTVWNQGQQMEVNEFKPTEMRNYIIQGDASLFVQVSTGKVIRYLFSNNFYDNKCLPINTVHDSLLFDVHVDVLDEAVPKICKILEDIPNSMKPLGYTLKMPYPVAPDVGKNWRDMEETSLDNFKWN